MTQARESTVMNTENENKNLYDALNIARDATKTEVRGDAARRGAAGARKRRGRKRRRLTNGRMV
jgi:hypothetical protein